MKNQRETALETFKAQSIKQDPISWHLWKRAFDEGVRYQEQLVKNNGVLGDVSVSLPDHYAGELNTERIKAYRFEAEKYHIQEDTVGKIWCAGADWYKSKCNEL